MNSTLLAAVDLYCERTGPELWSEPLNALSNLAFIAAGIWGLREIRRRRAGGFAEILGWWVVAIGVGSFIFHTWATRLTVWFDVVPIAAFTLAYSLFAFRHLIGLAWPRAVLAFVVFFAVAAVLTLLVPQSLADATNGTTGYLPAFLALVFFGLYLPATGKPFGWFIFAAACLFLVNCFFRIVDMSVCPWLPIGTHFLWHLGNGLMLGILLAAAARRGEAMRAGMAGA